MDTSYSLDHLLMNGGGPTDSSSGVAESRNFQDADDVVARLLKEHKDQQIKTEDEDIAAVVDRQLSSSFGGGSISQELSDCADLGAELGNHEANREEDEDEDMIAQPRICRICHKMDDRPVLHFAPVEYEMNVAAAAPHVQTFPLDIALHVFCGKTASILPNVNQPEYEILTKAGIKNKHGIGGEVNAALSRTRCAVLHETAGKEKQFYLVREFEAHLAAVRGYIQSGQQLQTHYNVASAAVASLDPSSTSRNSFGSNHTVNTQALAALTPTSSSSNAVPSFHGGGGSGGSLPGSTMLAALSGNGTLVSSPLGPSQPPSLSSFMMTLGSANLGSNNNTSSLDHIYSSGADLLNNSNGSPTLDQIESMIQQQQQLQQLQQTTTSALFSNSASSNSSSSISKVIPMKAGHVHTKHSPPQLNVPDFKVSCDCGGTHLSPHTPSGISSWKRHLTTKRHQKFLQDQQQLQFQMENSSTSSSMFGAAV